MLPATLGTSLSSLYSILPRSLALSLFHATLSSQTCVLYLTREISKGGEGWRREEKCLFTKKSFALTPAATRIVTVVKRNKGRRKFLFPPAGVVQLKFNFRRRSNPTRPTSHPLTSTAGSLFRYPLDLSDRYSPSVCTSVSRYFYLAAIRMAGAKLPRSAYTWEIRKLRNY